MCFWYEKYPVAGICSDSDENELSQSYGELVSRFKHLTKDDSYQCYITEKISKHESEAKNWA